MCPACKLGTCWVRSQKRHLWPLLQKLGQQLEEVARNARSELQQAPADLRPPTHDGAASNSSKGSPRNALPGLQDLRGRWNGSLQAYGGGGGATNLEFDVKGGSWQWGEYCLDQVGVAGSLLSLQQLWSACTWDQKKGGATSSDPLAACHHQQQAGRNLAPCC